MTSSRRSNWWLILTAALGLGPLGISIAMFATGVGAGEAARLSGLAVAIVSAALILVGLRRHRTDLVGGSQLIVAGAVLTLLGGLDFIPVGVIVLISGFWTGQLQLSVSADGPDLHPVRDHQIAMTRHWYLWLGGAVVLFAVGWLPLVFDDPDDLSSGGWFVWALSWLGAIITGGVGAILAGLRLTIRHRTRPA